MEDEGMFDEKEYDIVNALIEDELSTASKFVMESDGDNSIIWGYIGTLSNIRNKFAQSFKGK